MKKDDSISLLPSLKVLRTGLEPVQAFLPKGF